MTFAMPWKWMLLVACLFAAGCATRQEAPFVPKSSSLALTQWRLDGNPLVFDSVVALSADGIVKITLFKQAATPLLELQFGPGDQGSAHGPLVGRSWRGNLGNPPILLAPWAAAANILRNSDALPNGEREIHTGAYRAAVSKAGGKLKVLSIVSEDTGDVLTLRFRN